MYKMRTDYSWNRPDLSRLIAVTAWRAYSWKLLLDCTARRRVSRQKAAVLSPSYNQINL